MTGRNRVTALLERFAHSSTCNRHISATLTTFNSQQSFGLPYCSHYNALYIGAHCRVQQSKLITAVDAKSEKFQSSTESISSPCFICIRNKLLYTQSISKCKQRLPCWMQTQYCVHKQHIATILCEVSEPRTNISYFTVNTDMKKATCSRPRAT